MIPPEHEQSNDLYFISSQDLFAIQPNAPYCSAFHIDNLKECIKNGDFPAFSAAYHRPASGALRNTENASVQQARHSYMILLHIIASAAVDGGMPYEYSLDLFYRYCLALDRLRNISEIERLKLLAANDFCKRVAECRHTKPYHRTTIETIRYIHRHIYQRISIQELSGHVHLNRSTLSEYFKQDTGTTITAFINAAKLKEAKYLLEDQNIDYPQIIDLLGFCNQSYFIKKFREYFGVTPQQYRNQIL